MMMMMLSFTVAWLVDGGGYFSAVWMAECLVKKMLLVPTSNSVRI
jgi:hypothetical protein